MEIRLVVAFVLVIPLGLDLYMPVPKENPITREKIELGKKLFFDKRLSRDRTIACASCHQPSRAFTDGRRVAIGIDRREGTRNAPTIINRGYGRAFFWDARVATLEEQVLKPIEDPREMDLPAAEAARRVGLTPFQLSQALATFVRSVLSGDSPYDRYLNGDRRALDVERQAGLKVFRGKGNCTACHVGPILSDEQVHNTGVAWRNDALADIGAGNGAFKTPTLREISRTAPYMHDGSLATLSEVIDFYDAGGRANPWLDPELRPLRLSAREKVQLLAFLGALKGRSVP